MADTHAIPPDAQIMQAMFGLMVTKALAAAAVIGVADALEAGPLYYTDLARKVGADQRALHRTLRMLTSVGIFDEPSPGTYANNPPSDLLRAAHPASLRNMAVMIASESHWLPWGRYEDTVRSGRSGPQHAFGEDIFTWFQRSENQGQWRVFNDAMTSFSSMVGPAVARAYDFTPFRTIVDVGGGHGALLREILSRAPDAVGVICDLPGVVRGADTMGGRITVAGGNFFEAVPAGGDCYTLKHIIHDWSDEQAAAILANIAKVMKPDARVLVIETVMPESRGPHPAKFMDVNMLAMTEGGCERTEAEFTALFQRAGLRLAAVHPTESPVSIVEGRR
jgi:hypothetical protein